jgi:hypothetical protein
VTTVRTNGTQALVLLALAALPGACSDPFAPYSELDRLRVLAIASEPATPLPGQSAALSALTFAPGNQAIAYHWSWCPAAAPASQQYACPVDDVTAAQLFLPFVDPAVGALPPLALGEVPSPRWTNPFSPSALAGLCAAGLAAPTYAQSFDCDGGFPVTIVLDVATPSASLRAGFVLHLPVGDAPELNANPLPDGLALAGVPLGEPPVTIALKPEQTVDLDAVIPPSAIELRSIPASEGPPGQRLERLTASWFADAGKLDKARTSFIDGEAPLAQTSHNRWTAPKAADWPPDGVAEFAVVLRDDRGGAGWLVRHVVLEQAP